MGKVLVFDQPRSIRFDDYEERKLQPGEVRLQTLYSGISAGTQLTAYRGTNPSAAKQWNSEYQIFQQRNESSSMYPVIGGWAYEEVGQVTEIGANVTKIAVGDIIYGTWGHRSTHIVTETFASEHKLPEELDPVVGIFSQMGSIALNAILDAHIHVGETIVVFGQGVPGQIAVQLAKINGAHVIAVDTDELRLEHSRRNGADMTMNAAKVDIGASVKQLTGMRGADTVIEFSGFDTALHEAIRTVAYNGRVVVSGFYQGAATNVFLGEEFHHNRVQLICSQIGAIAPELSYRWNRLRMEQTIFELAGQGKLNLQGLISHLVPFSQSKSAYDMLDRRTEPALQVVLDFSE